MCGNTIYPTVVRKMIIGKVIEDFNVNDVESSVTLNLSDGTCVEFVLPTEVDVDLLIKKDEKTLYQSMYGNSIIGIWGCPCCGRSYFPRELETKHMRKPFKCELCNTILIYDEEV